MNERLAIVQKEARFLAEYSVDRNQMRTTDISTIRDENPIGRARRFRGLWASNYFQE